MPDYRKQSGVRGPTQGQFNKPGFFYPSAQDPINDYGLVERKTVDTKEQPVAYLASHPTLSALKLCKQTYEADEDGKKTRTRLYRTLPGAVLTKYVYDEELERNIEIRIQDVAIGTSISANALDLQVSDSETDQGWITRTTTRLSSLPDTRTEYRTEQFTFPALLQSVTAQVNNVGQGNVLVAEDTTEFHTGVNTFVSILPVIRPPITAPTQLKIVTTFYTSPPTKDTIYEILPNIVRFSGRLFDFNFGEVLNDSLSVTATAGTYDMNLLGLTETANFGASVPTKTQYNASIGQEKCIASDVIHYRGSIWMKRNTYVTLR